MFKKTNVCVFCAVVCFCLITFTVPSSEQPKSVFGLIAVTFPSSLCFVLFVNFVVRKYSWLSLHSQTCCSLLCVNKAYFPFIQTHVFCLVCLNNAYFPFIQTCFAFCLCCLLHLNTVYFPKSKTCVALYVFFICFVCCFVCLLCLHTVYLPFIQNMFFVLSVFLVLCVCVRASKSNLRSLHSKNICFCFLCVCFAVFSRALCLSMFAFPSSKNMLLPLFKYSSHSLHPKNIALLLAYSPFTHQRSVAKHICVAQIIEKYQKIKKQYKK